MEPEEIARYMDAYIRVAEYIGRSDLDADEARYAKNCIVVYRVIVPREIRDCAEIGNDLVRSLEERCNGIIAKGESSSL